MPLFCSEDLDRFGAGMAVAVQGGSVITVITKGPRLPKLGHLSCSASHHLFAILVGIASWWWLEQWNVYIAATWCPSQRLLVKSWKSARIHNVGLSWASWASDCARHEMFHKVFEFAYSFLSTETPQKDRWWHRRVSCQSSLGSTWRRDPTLSHGLSSQREELGFVYLPTKARTRCRTVLQLASSHSVAFRGSSEISALGFTREFFLPGN